MRRMFLLDKLLDLCQKFLAAYLELLCPNLDPMTCCLLVLYSARAVVSPKRTTQSAAPAQGGDSRPGTSLRDCPAATAHAS
jgi:hypothetical protein